MPFRFDRPSVVDGLVDAGVLAPLDGARQELTHRADANTRGGGNLAVAEPLRAKREQQAIAGREPPQRVPQRGEPTVFVSQTRRSNHAFVIRGPRQPAPAPPLTVAQGVCGDREQPAMDVLGGAAGAEMPKQLQEGLLHHVFSVLMVPEQSDSETVDGGAVLPEQLLSGVRGSRGSVHRQPLV